MKNITGINRLILMLLFSVLLFSCKKEKEVECVEEIKTINNLQEYIAESNGVIIAYNRCGNSIYIYINCVCVVAGSNTIMNYNVIKGQKYKVHSCCSSSLDNTVQFKNECN